LPEDQAFDSLKDTELAESAETHHVYLNGLDAPTTEIVGNTGDSTMAEGGNNGPLSTNIGGSDSEQLPTPYQSPRNSGAAASPGFLSPIPSRAQSPTLDTAATQSGSDPPIRDNWPQESLPVISSYYGDTSQGSATAPQPTEESPPAVSSDSCHESCPKTLETPPLTEPNPSAPDPTSATNQDPASQLDPLLHRSPSDRSEGNKVQRVRKASSIVAEDDRNSQRRKRPRISKVSVHDLATAPEWFTAVLQLFEDSTLDSCWSDLVKLWTTFEEKESYIERGMLTAKNRPTLVSQWIGGGRRPTFNPTISDPAHFEKQFRRWWLTIQPEWRVSNGKLVKDMEGDWDSLRRPGKNGLLSVLAALFYWGLSVKNKSGAKKAWKRAVEDFQAVFHHLLA
jgi:hypothetical protein